MKNTNNKTETQKPMFTGFEQEVLNILPFANAVKHGNERWYIHNGDMNDEILSFGPSKTEIEAWAGMLGTLERIVEQVNLNTKNNNDSSVSCEQQKAGLLV